MATMAPGAAAVIAVSTEPDFAALGAALERQAKAIAEARAEDAQLGRTAPAQRWRSARLLWPLFVKG